MKRTVALFFCFLMMKTFVFAQDIDPVIQKMLDTGLIKQEQSDSVDVLVKSSGAKIPAMYLQALQVVEFKRITGFDFSPNITFSREGFTPAAQQELNRELSGYLLKLRACDLLSEKQVQFAQAKLEQSGYAHVMELLADLFMLSFREAQFKFKSDEINVFAGELHKNKVISKDALARLRSDLKAGNIDGPEKLMAYIDGVTVIDLSQYPDEPSIYLEQIHRKTASILPELDFTSFEYSIAADTAHFLDPNLVVSLKINDRIYRQESFINIQKSRDDFSKIDVDNYLRIFNKALADKQSERRLHTLMPGSESRFGVIALTKQQAEVLHGEENYLGLSTESFNVDFNSKGIDAAIGIYKEMGLLKHLSASQIDETREKISRKTIESFNDLLACFPSLVYSFDAELVNGDDPYAGLVNIYADLSRKDFNPTEVSDNFDAGTDKVTLNFTLGNRKYWKTFNVENNWLDPAFFDFITEVVRNGQLKGSFYYLDHTDSFSVIYLTQAQYRLLQQKKLATFVSEQDKD